MCSVTPCINKDIYADGKCFYHYKNTNRPEKAKTVKPIAKESKKRAIENRIDKKQNKDILAKQPLCQIKSPVCTKFAQGAHHLQGRTGNNLTNKDKKISACNACNSWVESHPKEAESMGVKISRNKK